MIGLAASRAKVKIRLTEERWLHITESHDELKDCAYAVLNCIENPDFIVKGITNELISCKKHGNKYLIVVYRENSIVDGFVITAYLTKNARKLTKRGILWKSK